MRRETADVHRGSRALEVSVIGPTVVTRDGVPVESQALCGLKPRQVLEVLAIHAGTPVPKDRLAELVWDGRPPRGHLGTLESYVCLLRRALGLSGRGAGIATVMHGYLLDPAVVRVDLDRFRTLVRQEPAAKAGPAHDVARLARLEVAVGMVQGELLASETYATWAIRERERFTHELATAATEGAACAVRLGRPETAVALAQVAVRHEPYGEEAWRHLMDGLCALNRRPEALRAYLHLKDLLAEELGACPSPATTERYLAALGRWHQVDEVDGNSRDELRMLLALVRRTVLSVPGVDVTAVEHGLVRLAATVAAAS